MMDSGRFVRTVQRGSLLLIAVLGLMQASVLAAPPVSDDNAALPGTQPLKMEGDIASQLVEGVDRFLIRKLSETREHPEILKNFRPGNPQGQSDTRRRLAHLL